MKKTVLYSLLFVIGAAGVVFAQEVEVQNESDVSTESEQIELPEITAEISTEDLIAPSDVIPDFSEIITVQEGSTGVVPVIPEIADGESVEDEKSVYVPRESSIFAEGKFGGGYPLGIHGDFKLSHLSELNPFQLSFTHDYAAGYTRTGFSEGYNDSKTRVDIDKTFDFDKVTLDVDVDFENDRDGLQGKVTDISAVTKNSLYTKAAAGWNFAKGFTLYAGLGINGYNRYLESAANPVPANWSLGFAPETALVWKDYGFEAGIDLGYSFDYEQSVVSRLVTGLKFSKILHPAREMNLKLFSDVHFVAGNELNGNNVVVPFTLGTDITFPVDFATRDFKIYAAGGLDSSRNKTSYYENFYKFSSLDFNASEVSDWFGNIKVTVPVSYSFTGTAKIEYRHTALGNGILEPIYESGSCVNGLYQYSVRDRGILVTGLDLSYFYKILTCNLQWTGNWFYVPVLESPMNVKLSLTVQSDNSRFSGTFSAGMGIRYDGVELPVLDLSGFAKLTDQVGIVASLEDMINLFGGPARIYGGQYVSRGGTANLLIKFSF